MAEFAGKGIPLTQQGFDDVCGALGGDAASLWSLLTVETRGFGFRADRRPKILFERHVFHKRTGGRFSAANSDISNPASGGWGGEAEQYGRLGRAMQLDRRAALESASWGLGQVMGYHAVKLRYAGVEEMITRFADGEDGQLEGVHRFILDNPALDSAFRAKNWPKVAFSYNGANYAANNYDQKLDRYYQLYTAHEPPSIEVRAAQARLVYLNFDPRGVDGLLGDGTRVAVIAFQKARGLPVNGQLDDRTRDELKAAANT